MPPDVFSGCSITKPFQNTLTCAIAYVMSKVKQFNVGEAVGYEGKCIDGEATITVCGSKSRSMKSGRRVWCESLLSEFLLSGHKRHYQITKCLQQE